MADFYRLRLRHEPKLIPFRCLSHLSLPAADSVAEKRCSEFYAWLPGHRQFLVLRSDTTAGRFVNFIRGF
ncbi:MAG: hypothetical protein ACLQBD_20290 [Syntrophobacteraceae bacterium]